MPHMLLTAKLNAYGFSIKTLRLMNNPKRKINKSNKSYKTFNKTWKQILFRVLQGSVLRPISCQHLICFFFGMKLTMLIMLMTAPFIKHVKILMLILFKWFRDNQMKDNTDKFHVTLSIGD